MKKKACYVDLMWWSGESGQIVGDMYFTTQERPESLTLDIAGTKNAMENCLQTKADPTEFLSEDGYFAIYELWEVEAEEEPWWGHLDLDTAVLTDVYVCATEEQAEDADIEDFYGYYHPNIHYYYGK